ncbi:MAG: DUF945 family protein [Thiotrichaceae bacterium]|nr:DUF945 family protein [Thiotrichaceae bacterium]
MSQLKHLEYVMKASGAVLFLLIALALTWFGIVSYSAYHAELTVKKIFPSTEIFYTADTENSQNHSFQFELLNYDRGLLRSNATLRLRSNHRVVDKMLEDLVFEIGIKQGPIIISSGYFHFEKALIQVGVVGKPDVLNLQMMLGFDDLLQYTVNLADLSYQEGHFNFVSTKGSGAGVINFSESLAKSKLALTIDQVDFSLAEQSVKILGNKLVYHLSNSLVIQSTMKHNGKKTSLLQDLQIPVLMEHILSYQQWDDIQKQIAWTLEFSGTLQEGRDQLVALYVRSDELQMIKDKEVLSQCFDQPSLKTVAMRKVNQISK